MTASTLIAALMLTGSPIELEGPVTCMRIAPEDLLDRITCEVNQVFDYPDIEGTCTFPTANRFTIAENEDAVLIAKGECTSLNVSARLKHRQEQSCSVKMYLEYGDEPEADENHQWIGRLGAEAIDVLDIEESQSSRYTIKLSCSEGPL